MNKEHNQWLNKYYNQLKGYTIIDFRIEKLPEEYYCLPNEFPVFTLEDKEGHIIEIKVSRDEEMNGSGFLILSEANK